MPTNIELERSLTALKQEVAELKSALAKMFSNRYFEQPETSLGWDRLTKTAEVSAKEAAAVIHKTPATPTPATESGEWLAYVNKAIEEQQGQ
jgi:hypothetical protein